MVYNITVEGEHEYFANGVLVHNCHAVLYGYRDTPAYSNALEPEAKWRDPAAGTALEGLYRPPPAGPHPGLRGAFGIGSLPKRRG